MAIDQERLKLQARFIAIEHMIGHIFKVLFAMAGATPAMIEESQQKFREYLRNESFGGHGIDAASSDLMAAELEEAFDNLLKTIAEMAEVETKRK